MWGRVKEPNQARLIEPCGTQINTPFGVLKLLGSTLHGMRGVCPPEWLALNKGFLALKKGTAL